MMEAVASMEMAPGALPRPGRVPEQRLLSPELGFWMAAEIRVVFRKILRVSRVLGQEGFYRRRGDTRRCTSKRHPTSAPPPSQPRPGGVWGLWASPGLVLLAPGVF